MRAIHHVVLGLAAAAAWHAHPAGAQDNAQMSVLANAQMDALTVNAADALNPAMRSYPSAAVTGAENRVAKGGRDLPQGLLPLYPAAAAAGTPNGNAAAGALSDTAMPQGVKPPTPATGPIADPLPPASTDASATSVSSDSGSVFAGSVRLSATRVTPEATSRATASAIGPGRSSVSVTISSRQGQASSAFSRSTSFASR